MQFNRIFLIALVLAGLGAAVAPAQEPREEPQQQEASSAGIFSLIPDDATTEHVLKTSSGDLSYTATAGTIDLFAASGNRTAKVFYTAYVARDRRPGRPLTFAFNGGPGAASAYLHLGLLGPRILDFGPERNDGTAPKLVDNPDSWLAFTDLVLIDPVGTGWSRAASDDIARNFWSVEQDAASLAKVITLYVQKNNRLDSPKYIAGESYGGFRAAKVAASLKDGQGILVDGVVMVSPFIVGRFLATSDEDPLAAALQLPSLAAAELERKNAFSTETMVEIERFAMTNYLVSLAGAAPTGTAGEAFYSRVSILTGIPRETVARARGFVGGLYGKNSVPGGRIVSAYDAAYSAPDAYPEADGDHNDDPILEGFTRAYGGAMASYARNELGFKSEMTYELLNSDVNRRWQWNGNRGGDGRLNATASGDLRDLLSVIPSMKLLISHGYSDAITPYGVSRYVVDHLPPALAAGRAELKLYRGGHMFYTDPASRRAFAEDARVFYEGEPAD